MTPNRMFAKGQPYYRDKLLRQLDCSKIALQGFILDKENKLKWIQMEMHQRSAIGLPCAHEVASIMREVRVFLLTDVHVFWRELDWFGVLSTTRYLVEINAKSEDCEFEKPQCSNSQRKTEEENWGRSRCLSTSEMILDKRGRKEMNGGTKNYIFHRLLFLVYNFGTENFNSFMVPYVVHLQNVLGDGNCGFRALAGLLGFDEEQWTEMCAIMWREL